MTRSCATSCARSCALSASPGDEVPLDLGFKAWWTAEEGYYTTATGVDTLTDKISGYVLNQATGSQQPTYNATGGFASGRPSFTFASASTQLLSGAAGLASQLDHNQPFTAAISLRVVSGGANKGVFDWTSASNQLAGLWFTSTIQNRHRYRDAATLLQASGTTAGSTATDSWAVISYDGNDTIYVESSWEAEDSQTGASAVDFDATSVTLGSTASIGAGDFECLDFLIAPRFLGVSGTRDRVALQSFLERRMAY